MIDFLIGFVVFAAMALISIGVVYGALHLADLIQEHNRKDRQ